MLLTSVYVRVLAGHETTMALNILGHFSLRMQGSQACKRCSSSLSSFRDILRSELEGIRAAGTWKHERVITSPQAASIRVRERSGDVLNFCANNYLGLSVRRSANIETSTRARVLCVGGECRRGSISDPLCV